MTHFNARGMTQKTRGFSLILGSAYFNGGNSIWNSGFTNFNQFGSGGYFSGEKVYNVEP